MIICTWLHYWQLNDRVMVIIRLSGEVCTGDLAWDEPMAAEWIVA